MPAASTFANPVGGGGGVFIRRVLTQGSRSINLAGEARQYGYGRPKWPPPPSHGSGSGSPQIAPPDNYNLSTPAM